MNGDARKSNARLRWSLALLGLFVTAPLILSIAAATIGAMLGCQVDESGIHPCPLFGVDIGGWLYVFGMLFWLGIFMFPMALFGFVVWLGVVITLLVRRRRRSTPT
jgi:hypothetical protein